MKVGVKLKRTVCKDSTLAVICLATLLFLLVVWSNSSTQNNLSELNYDSATVSFVVERESDSDNVITSQSNQMVKDMRDRVQHFHDTCRTLGLAGQKVVPSNYFISSEYKLVWCSIFKSGASNWVYRLNILAGYTPEYLNDNLEKLLGLARKKYKVRPTKMLKKADREYATFLVVRDPFVRLVSAYRDKILNCWPDSFHDKLGRSIAKHYRKNSSNTDIRPQFNEFVQFLIDQRIAKKPPDIHWQSYSKFCTPCGLDVNYIIKLENKVEDDWLLEQLHLHQLKNVTWKNPTKGGTSKNNSTIKTYISQLSKQELLDLYKIYEVDFKLFAYTIDPYLKYIDK